MGRLLPAMYDKMLRQESGISAALIESRGYRYVDNPKELIELGFAKSQALPGLLIPIWGVDGTVVGYQLRPDEPRRVNGKDLKYETPAGWSMRLDIHPTARETLRDPTKPLWITEGVKKADSALVRGLCCVALMGVWNWRGPLGELPDWDAIALKDRQVYIAYDSDVMTKRAVRLALRRLAAVLKRRGAHVHAIVPNVPGSTKKLGLDDFFSEGGTLEGLYECEDPSLIASSSRPEVECAGTELKEMVDQSLEALAATNDPAKLFLWGGNLGRVSPSAAVSLITPSGMAYMLSAAAKYQKTTLAREGVKVTPCEPPKGVVASCLDQVALEEHEFPLLMGVSKSPVLSPSGRIATEPGYDHDSQYYIALSEPVPKWEGDAQSAAKWIREECFADFPFDSEASLANAYAAMLTGFCLPMIQGPTPLHMFEAATPRTGKGLLAETCLIPFLGSSPAMTPISDNPKGADDEMKAEITAKLLHGANHIFFDNIDANVKSAALAGALTANYWSGRIKGESRMFEGPIKLVWAATANNPTFSLDISKRCVPIRLDAGLENPEKRFEATPPRHDPIVAWVKAERLTIISAVVAMIEGWVAAGQLPLSGISFGSYESYTSVIGGILNHAGVTGFLDNLETSRERSDTESGGWRGLVDFWWVNFGEKSIRPGELLDKFFSESAGDEYTREELSREFAGPGPRTSQLSRLGRKLGKKEGAVYSDLKIVRIADKRNGTSFYQLAPAPFAGGRGPICGGSAGGRNSQTALDFEPDCGGLRGVAGGFDNPSHMHTHTHTHTRGAVSPNPPQPPASGSRPPATDPPQTDDPPRWADLGDDEEIIL